ncbi:MAG: AAA family ATPase [bacterium]|nr:AAA family ATPase [bacterium]
MIIDEAQNLDADALENVRLLQNLASPGKNNLQLVLSSQPGLESTIARPGCCNSVNESGSTIGWNP